MSYEPVFHASTDSDGRWYVKGPSGDAEFGYYGGTLAPSSRYETAEVARRVAHYCNLAYREGERAAKRRIQKAIGLAT